MLYINLPTGLTLVRLIVSPIVLPLLIVYGIPLGIMWLNAAIALFFIMLSLTDFFDGFLARRLNKVSFLGKALDPLADKFLVYATLVGLLAIQKIYFYWVVLLIGRDFFMMGLRQIALERGFSVDVSWFGKVKTAVLMLYLTIALISPSSPYCSCYTMWYVGEQILLTLTLLLSLWSAKAYYDNFVIKFKQKDQVDVL